MLLTIITFQLLILAAFLLLKYSCQDMEKSNLKYHKMKDDDYYHHNPSKKQSLIFASIAIVGMMIITITTIILNFKQ